MSRARHRSVTYTHTLKERKREIWWRRWWQLRRWRRAADAAARALNPLASSRNDRLAPPGSRCTRHVLHSSRPRVEGRERERWQQQLAGRRWKGRRRRRGGVCVACSVCVYGSARSVQPIEIFGDSFRCGSSPGSGLESRGFFHCDTFCGAFKNVTTFFPFRFRRCYYYYSRARPRKEYKLNKQIYRPNCFLIVAPLSVLSCCLPVHRWLRVFFFGFGFNCGCFSPTF